MSRRCCAAALFALIFAFSRASGQEPSFGLIETLYAAGFEKPTGMAFLPDGRLFVSEQDGALWAVPAGGGPRTLVLTVPTEADYTGRGLLGFTPDPEFEANGYLYLYFTRESGGAFRSVVARVTLEGSAMVADSERTLIILDAQSTNRHSGGTLRFGPDGMLYLGNGDNAQPDTAQSMTTRFGKMLRYNADGTIPSDNPFFETAEGDNRAIWALGLRNPYTFAFNTAGDLYINDVGEDTWEEINVGAAGANYGWPQVEGPETLTAFRPPLFAFTHEDGRCAATGALFYTGTQLPEEFSGDYLFTELCTSTIYALDPASTAVTRVMTTAAVNLIDLDLGPDGALYALGYADGVVVRIAPAGE